MKTRHEASEQRAAAARIIKRCAQLAALVAALAVGVTSSWALPWRAPTAAQLDGPVELVGAVKRRLVRIDSAKSVGGADRLELGLSATQPLEVTITAGTYFRYHEDEGGPVDPVWPQNLVVTRTTTVRLSRGDLKTIEVPTACANHKRRTPVVGERYVLGTAPRALRDLFTCLSKARYPERGMQMAVWAATSPWFSAQLARNKVPRSPSPEPDCSRIASEALRAYCVRHFAALRAERPPRVQHSPQALEILRRCGVVQAAGAKPAAR